MAVRELEHGCGASKALKSKSSSPSGGDHPSALHSDSSSEVSQWKELEELAPSWRLSGVVPGTSDEGPPASVVMAFGVAAAGNNSLRSFLRAGAGAESEVGAYIQHKPGNQDHEWQKVSPSLKMNLSTNYDRARLRLHPSEGAKKKRKKERKKEREGNKETKTRGEVILDLGGVLLPLRRGNHSRYRCIMAKGRPNRPSKVVRVPPGGVVNNQIW